MDVIDAGVFHLHPAQAGGVGKGIVAASGEENLGGRGQGLCNFLAAFGPKMDDVSIGNDGAQTGQLFRGEFTGREDVDRHGYSYSFSNACDSVGFGLIVPQTRVVGATG